MTIQRCLRVRGEGGGLSLGLELALEVSGFDWWVETRPSDAWLTRGPTREFPMIHGVLAAPPCTVFANSGARWHRTDDAMREGLSVVDACLRIVYATRPAWWVLENPAGKLSRYLGPPRMTFQPNDYGDDYTKLTCLWGRFMQPARTPVPAVAGSKLHRLGPSEDRAALRSVTPKGFARAFFEANP